MNRPGFLLGRKCEGNAVEPQHFRLKELQDLAKLYDIPYAGLSKDRLCSILRNFYLEQEMASSFVIGDEGSPRSSIPSPRSPTSPTFPTSSRSSSSRIPLAPPMPAPQKPSQESLSSTSTSVSASASNSASTTSGKGRARLPPPTIFPSQKGKQSATSKTVVNIEKPISPEKPKSPKSPKSLEKPKSPKSPEKPEEKSSFYSDTNPGGFIRKIEFRNLAPEVPFFIFNLERKLDEDQRTMRQKITTQPITPTQYIGIGDTPFIHKATVIFDNTKNHYTTVFNCSDPEFPEADNWYYYDDTSPRIKLLATSHAELIQRVPAISTNGVLHFYTNYNDQTESPFNPCVTLGPQFLDNSCYMDSTLLALFALSNKYLLDALLVNNLTSFQDDKMTSGKLPQYKCSEEVKKKIRVVLEEMLEYFMNNGVSPRKFCTDLRPLFNQCRFRNYESFGNTAIRSPSEFLTYLFLIFGISGPGLVKYTWGTNDLDANPDSLFADDDEVNNPDKAAFKETSVNDVGFNYVIEVGPYKINEYAGQTTNDLLASVDDNILI